MCVRIKLNSNCFNLKYNCFINSQIISLIVTNIIFHYNISSLINLLLHKKYLFKKQTYFFICLIFFIFVFRFRGFSYILKVLFLYKTNKYLKYSIFPSLNQFIYLFSFCNCRGQVANCV
jgi:hypothetical protein